MNNHDFYRTGDKIRKMCKGMTARQVEDLIQLMRMDLYERPDADRPADEWIALRLDRGRGGYRPDEVAHLMREAAAFGENKGRRGMTDEMVAELRREMRRTLLAG